MFMGRPVWKIRVLVSPRIKAKMDVHKLKIQHNGWRLGFTAKSMQAILVHL
jgi:hypothetical protein